MLDIGGWEFLLVAFVLIMVVGPKELPRMLRTFTGFSKQMRKMAREFTDGMNKIADDAEVADLKKAMNKARSGDLDDLANAIDPGGEVGDSVRELKDSLDKDNAADDLKDIGKIADEAGKDIVDDAIFDDGISDDGISDDGISDDVAPVESRPAPKAKKAAGKKS